MTTPILTNMEVIAYLLANPEKCEDKAMGTIRTKEKCPKCNKPFKHIQSKDKHQKLGFICIKHKTRPVKYYIDLSWKGKRIRIFSHKSGRILDSYQISLETLQHINYEIRNHTFDPSKYIASDIKKFLSENLLTRWLDTKEKAGLALSYIPKLKQFNRDYFKYFNGHDVRDTRTSHIYEFLHQLPQHLKNKTKKNIMSALNNFYSWLYKMEYIEKMPVFPTIETEHPEWKWIDVDVQSQIILSIPEQDRYIYVFLALHGARPSEARALKVKDVDFDHSSLTIRRTFAGKSGNILIEHTKTKRHRTIPINPEMIDLLKILCKDKLPEAFVFTNPRTHIPYARTTYQEIWQEACKKTGVKISSYEGLRHSFASQRVSRGVDIYLISKVLGHTDIRTTQKYSHTNLESLKTIMSVNEIYNLSPNRHQGKKSSKYTVIIR